MVIVQIFPIYIEITRRFFDIAFVHRLICFISNARINPNSNCCLEDLEEPGSRRPYIATVSLIKAGCDTSPSYHITTTLMGGTVELVTLKYLERNTPGTIHQRRGYCMLQSENRTNS